MFIDTACGIKDEISAVMLVMLVFSLSTLRGLLLQALSLL
jgi:hypothetical protein